MYLKDKLWDAWFIQELGGQDEDLGAALYHGRRRLQGVLSHFDLRQGPTCWGAADNM